eukprot:CAMPEP_0197035816 /NCGR_PEP_ID=MMETSP1384-20130603/13499_1 /TAXON_ID=29189 /ORGANISM="Ammonia sp." /LENGTH=129 /DNA_ID=CAMNT_0042465915 /DNA_START=131 /DNA_END=520 /DNA_ORIENTATION=-
MTAHGKVWDFDAVNNEWNILDHSLVSMAVPHFVITSPMDTALWNQGDWVNITWNSQQHTFNTVTIGLFTQKGEKVLTIVHSADDNGLLHWLVDIPVFYSVDTLFELRLSSTAYTHVYSKSGYFRINHPH